MERVEGKIKTELCGQIQMDRGMWMHRQYIYEHWGHDVVDMQIIMLKE